MCIQKTTRSRISSPCKMTICTQIILKWLFSKTLSSPAQIMLLAITSLHNSHCRQRPQDPRIRNFSHCRQRLQDPRIRKFSHCRQRLQDPRIRKFSHCRQRPQDPRIRKFSHCRQRPQDPRIRKVSKKIRCLIYI